MIAETFTKIFFVISYAGSPAGVMNAVSDQTCEMIVEMAVADTAEAAKKHPDGIIDDAGKVVRPELFTFACESEAPLIENAVRVPG